MRRDTWIILAAALLVLLVIARYMQHQELPAVCTDHPTAPECPSVKGYPRANRGSRGDYRQKSLNRVSSE